MCVLNLFIEYATLNEIKALYCRCITLTTNKNTPIQEIEEMIHEPLYKFYSACNLCEATSEDKILHLDPCLKSWKCYIVKSFTKLALTFVHHCEALFCDSGTRALDSHGVQIELVVSAVLEVFQSDAGLVCC